MKDFILYVLAIPALVVTGVFFAHDCKAETYYTTLGPAAFSREAGNYDVQNLTEILRQATSTDRVCIFIDSPGGYISVLYPLLNEMYQTRAETVAVVTNRAYSAAAVTAFTADFIEFQSPISRMMFHMVQQNGVPIESSSPSFKIFMTYMYITNRGRMDLSPLERKEDIWLTLLDVQTWYNYKEGLCD